MHPAQTGPTFLTKTLAGNAKVNARTAKEAAARGTTTTTMNVVHHSRTQTPGAKAQPSPGSTSLHSNVVAGSSCTPRHNHLLCILQQQTEISAALAARSEQIRPRVGNGCRARPLEKGGLRLGARAGRPQQGPRLDSWHPLRFLQEDLQGGFTAGCWKQRMARPATSSRCKHRFEQQSAAG